MTARCPVGRHVRRSVAACLIACVPASAGAVSLGYSEAGLSFTLVGMSAPGAPGVEIGAAVGLADQGRFENPGGTANGGYELAVLGNPAAIGIGEGLELGSSARTSAVGPSGLADAFTYTDGVLSLRNTSDTRVRLDFALSFDLSATASAQAPQEEAAFSRAAIGVLSATHGALFRAAAEADTVFGPLADMILDSLAFSLRLRPQQTETLYLTADTEASAASLATIPVPPALVLLLGGLGGLALLARRARALR